MKICSAFKICGGCSVQDVAPLQQISEKTAALIASLQQYNIASYELAPSLQGSPWHYRSRARLGVKWVLKKDSVLIGFRERNGRYLTDTTECLILEEKLASLLLPLRKLFATLELKDKIAQLEAIGLGHITALVIRHMQPLPISDLAKIKEFAALHNIWLYLQPYGTYCEKIFPLDNDLLFYELPAYNIRLHFQPLSFTQINLEINALMLEQAIAWLEIKPNEKLLDLFCGIGNFSLPLAKKANYVYGVELNKEAVNMAIYNANYNAITNVSFQVADLTNSIEFAQLFNGIDKVLLDPPRSGAKEVIPHIVQSNINTVLYISCNPETLAQDSALLAEQGFILQRLGAIDMFPHTNHLEAMALFKRKSW